MLPKVVTRTEVVVVDGEEVKVRGLLRSESFDVKQKSKESDEEAEILILAFGTDTPVDEVREWYAGATNLAVQELLDKIVRLSGLGPGAAKSG